VVTFAGRTFIRISLTSKVKVTWVTGQIAIIKVSSYCSPPRRAILTPGRSTPRGEGPTACRLGCEADTHTSASYPC
jgi:hypothetical protein